MAIQIPEDLEVLQSIASPYPRAPVTVYNEARDDIHPIIEGPELPLLRLEPEDGENGYVQFFTHPDGSPGSLLTGMSMTDVVTRLRSLVVVGVERELFWVSGAMPMGENGVSDDAEAWFRLCLPLVQVGITEEPERVVFIASSGSVTGRREGDPG